MDIETLKLISDIMEAVMIISFGVSWPFNVAKSLKTKSTKGKSIIFLSLITFGYIVGVTMKLIDPTFDWSTRWWIFACYVFNLIMVSWDLILYFINSNREKKQINE